MGWKIVPMFATPHLEPILESGSALTNHPIGNIGGQSLRRRGGWSGSCVIRWDRGITSGRSLNCVVIAGSNIGTKGLSVNVKSRGSVPVSGGTSHLTGVNPGLVTYFGAFTASTPTTNRYLGVEVSGGAVAGFVGIGKYYDVGNVRKGGSMGTVSSASGGRVDSSGFLSSARPGAGSRAVSYTVEQIAQATAEEIVYLASVQYDYASSGSTAYRQGVGGGGGSNLIALVDPDDLCILGRGTITMGWPAGRQNKSLTITIAEDPDEGPI